MFFLTGLDVLVWYTEELKIKENSQICGLLWRQFLVKLSSVVCIVCPLSNKIMLIKWKLCQDHPSAVKALIPLFSELSVHYHRFVKAAGLLKSVQHRFLCESYHFHYILSYTQGLWCTQGISRERHCLSLQVSWNLWWNVWKTWKWKLKWCLNWNPNFL